MFVKNEVVVKAWVQVSGYVNKEIQVEMSIVDPQGRTARLAPRLACAPATRRHRPSWHIGKN